MKQILLIQEAGASALRLCPQDPSFSNGERFYFEINQKFGYNSTDKPIFIDLSHDVTKYSDFHKENRTQTYQHSKPDFNTIEEALEFLKEKFGKVFYFHANEKMLRSGVTVEHILGRKQTGPVRILENEALLFIAKNPKVTTKELAAEFDKDTAGYVDRWKHDYGQDTTPFIEVIEKGWIITNNGLAFICNKEASY